MTANTKQVGGSHYNTGTGAQHWDYAAANFGPGYFKGNATKYLARAHRKHGIEDLQKAQHYMEKMAEIDWLHLNWVVAGHEKLVPQPLLAQSFIHGVDGLPEACAKLIYRITVVTGRKHMLEIAEDIGKLIDSWPTANL